LQKFRIIRITNYFPTDKSMDRVHISVDWPVCSVHRGPTLVRTEGTTVRSPELGLRPLWCTNAHRRGHKMERGARGTRLGSHRSSGGDEEAGRRQCRRGRRRRSVRGRLECGEKRREAGRGAVSSGVVLAFYRGRGSAGEGWPGWLTPALMALTPLKMAGLMRG
jgi:hypothetical protein